MPTWQETALRAQHHRDSTLAAISPPLPPLPSPLPLDVTGIPKTILTAEELSITESLPEDLLASLATGALTAHAVTSAFLRRAALAQHLSNCITELLPARALARAKELDEHLAATGKPVGPLHGLPVSVKEHVGVKGGLAVNAAFVSWFSEEVSEKDALIVKILDRAGAVVFARTTEPQLLMHLETSSNLYGVTVNPHNRNLTSGGSSGGEGALMALRGSCLGIGTDIGGSIRSPAANCGVFGFKPTSYRLPVMGMEHTMGGSEHIVGAVGPLSTSLEGIKLLLQTVLSTAPWLHEPSLIPLPWTPPPPRTKPLRIGLLLDDSIVRPHPPIRRALHALAKTLSSTHAPDISLTTFSPHRHDLAWPILSSLYFADGGAEEATAVDASGEPWLPLSDFILRDNPLVRHLDIAEVWALTVRREAYRAAYAEAWNATDEGEGIMDVILCPAGPGAAPPLDCARYWGYTAVWNLLDYPALVFPVSRVDPAVDVRDEAYVPRNEEDAYNHALYDPTLYANAPVSLQLVGRRYRDESVIEAYEILQKYL